MPKLQPLQLHILARVHYLVTFFFLVQIHNRAYIFPNDYRRVSLPNLQTFYTKLGSFLSGTQYDVNTFDWKTQLSDPTITTEVAMKELRNGNRLYQSKVDTSPFFDQVTIVGGTVNTLMVSMHTSHTRRASCVHISAQQSVEITY